jgi:hypothetical protein
MYKDTELRQDLCCGTVADSCSDLCCYKMHQLCKRTIAFHEITIARTLTIGLGHPMI